MRRNEDGRVFRRDQQLYPQLEATPDISRAEERFAAEVALAEFQGQLVPTFAHERAVSILQTMSKG